MDLQSVFSGISQTFSMTKDVTIGECVLTIMPLSAGEEIKVLEACKEYEGGQYLTELKLHTLAYCIRKINGASLSDQIEIYGDDGKPVKITRYLFLLRMLGPWTSTLRDVLFEAYTEMLVELDVKVQDKVKFKRFVVAKSSEEAGKEAMQAPNGFKKVEEPLPETEVEALGERVKRENEDAQIALAKTEQEAVQTYGKK